MRRTRLVGPQASLWPDWRHFAFLTDLEGPATDIDAFHRHHAVVELAIDDLKEGAGMEHCPSGDCAERGVAVLAVLAHNLMRWTASLGDLVKSTRPSWWPGPCAPATSPCPHAWSTAPVGLPCACPSVGPGRCASAPHSTICVPSPSLLPERHPSGPAWPQTNFLTLT